MKLSRKYSLKEVAELINCKFIGEPNFEITGMNEIHMVEKGDITFVDHPKYYDKALNSSATTILINKEVECPQGKALLVSQDPFMDYNYLTRKFRTFEKSDSFISPTAKIGKNTIIQPGVFIGHNSIIGDNCVIHSNVSIYDNCVIGNNVMIHANTVIGADAFYFQKRANGYNKMHTCGRVIIEDDVEIGANCCIDKGVSGDTVIGKGTKMDNLIQIGHDTKIGERCLFASQVGIAGVTKIEDDVILWGQVGVNKDLVVAKRTVVLAKSGLGKSTEKGEAYFGIPAKKAKIRMKEVAIEAMLPDMFDKIYKNK